MAKTENRKPGVLLAFFWCWCSITQKNTRRTPEERQKNTRRTPEERQKNARRTPEEPRRTQKNTRRETTAMSVTAVTQTETTSDFI